MDYVEEITPSKNIIKILLGKNQFLVFDSKGSSVYADAEGRSLVHSVPVIVFIGKFFKVIRSLNGLYTMLKVRRGAMILPYRDMRDKKKKYIFIDVEREIEMIPVRIFYFPDIIAMVREFDITNKPDYAIVDDMISSNDIIIVKNRFKVGQVINADINNNLSLIGYQFRLEKKRSINLNMMSENPFFLAMIHLRDLNFSLINQLLLDFDISIIDIEFIILILNQRLALIEGEDEKYRPRLVELLEAFRFYHNLLNRDGDVSRKMIDGQSDFKELSSMRTLISKAKSIYPNREEQVFFNDIDEYLVARQTSLRQKK